MKIVKAVSHLDVYIEQPCVSYRECQSIRSHTNLPFVLDENISEFNHLVAVAQDNSADVVNIKISKFGGLTKAKLVIHLIAFMSDSKLFKDYVRSRWRNVICYFVILGSRILF